MTGSHLLSLEQMIDQTREHLEQVNKKLALEFRNAKAHAGGTFVITDLRGNDGGLDLEAVEYLLEIQRKLLENLRLMEELHENGG